MAAFLIPTAGSSAATVGSVFMYALSIRAPVEWWSGSILSERLDLYIPDRDAGYCYWIDIASARLWEILCYRLNGADNTKQNCSHWFNNYSICTHYTQAREPSMASKMWMFLTVSGEGNTIIIQHMFIKGSERRDNSLNTTNLIIAVEY